MAWPLRVEFGGPDGPEGQRDANPVARALAEVQEGRYDAALYFPPGFGERLDAFRRAIEERAPPPEMPRPKIPENKADDTFFIFPSLPFAAMSPLMALWETIDLSRRACTTLA